MPNMHGELARLRDLCKSFVPWHQAGWEKCLEELHGKAARVERNKGEALDFRASGEAK